MFVAITAIPNSHLTIFNFCVNAFHLMLRNFSTFALQRIPTGMMLPNVPVNANYFTMVEPSTSSTCNATKHRRRSLWRLAKRLIRPMSDHQTPSFNQKLSLHYGNVDSKRRSEQLVPPILLNVFEQINIYHRIRLRQVWFSIFAKSFL